MLKEVGGVVLAPRVENTAVAGVHLAPTSQTQFNRQVAEGVARLLCQDCGLPPVYFKQRYSHILRKTICHLKPPKVQLAVPDILKNLGDEAWRKERRRQRRVLNVRQNRRVTFQCDERE